MWVLSFPFHITEVFNYDLFKYFLKHFLFSIPYDSNVGMFNVVPEASETVPISFHSFFFILLGFPDSSVGKESACNAGDTGFDLWVGKIHWRRDRLPTPVFLGFLVAQLVKNPPAVWETCIQSLGWKDPLEKGKATHSSILAWRIP